MTGPAGDYWQGYERGVQTGHTTGYREGLDVLTDAAGALAGTHPARALDVEAARRRRAEQTGPSLTPRELRTQAAESWGLPVPEDLAASAGEPDAAAPATEASAAELTDDDDWAWQA